ncbi:hypothetical protein [Butyrivibrio sp. M55]|uniref:hypothetical protein n=1 Tax=Butyrivibrio sp. M55 TaxID=1855323 RepID=UPI0008EAE8F1|nr:hypothetical protein [Butyrivibrio sp. M55]SFU31931.1 hypothetical protein SAMN05216540_10148 [Butyrivibrio sp. M55]
MEKKKIISIALMIGICVLMWGIFFMLGIKTIGAVLAPIVICLICWGAGVAYDKLIDKTGENKKTLVTILLLAFLGVLSVLFLSEGKDIAGKVVSFIFPGVLGGMIFAGGCLGNKCKADDAKKLNMFKGIAVGVGVVFLLLYVFAVFNKHVIGTLNDVLQMIVFGVIFFVASFLEKTSESECDDTEESAIEEPAETVEENTQEH